MINVSEINKTKELNTAKAAKKTNGENFSSYLQKATASSSAQVSAMSNINVADAVLAAQMINDEEEREIRKNLVKRGNSLLEKLEEIRAALLDGSISMNKLIEISRFVKERRFNTQDQRLGEIIAEIELRVEVELAKLMK